MEEERNLEEQTAETTEKLSETKEETPVQDVISEEQKEAPAQEEATAEQKEAPAQEEAAAEPEENPAQDEISAEQEKREAFIRQRKEERRVDTAAKRSVLFGVLGIIGAILLPLAGVIFSVLGLRCVKQAEGSSLENKIKTGRILSWIGLILSIALWIFNVVSVFG